MQPRKRRGRFISDALDVRLQLHFAGGPLDSVDLSVEFERARSRAMAASAFVGWTKGFGANADECFEIPGYDGHYKLAREQDENAWHFRWKGTEP